MNLDTRLIGVYHCRGLRVTAADERCLPMTWILGSGVMFGSGALISDVRVMELWPDPRRLAEDLFRTRLDRMQVLRGE